MFEYLSKCSLIFVKISSHENTDRNNLLHELNIKNRKKNYCKKIEILNTFFKSIQ